MVLLYMSIGVTQARILCSCLKTVMLSSIHGRQAADTYGNKKEWLVSPEMDPQSEILALQKSRLQHLLRLTPSRSISC
jgi:hypothetical protein